MDNPDKAPLVICGHGMVAQRLLENLVAGGHPYHRIVVFNAEPFNAYNRVRLSSLLAGEIEEPELELKPWQWYRKNQIGRASCRERVWITEGAVVVKEKD